jgi:hypothetical protein
MGEKKLVIFLLIRYIQKNGILKKVIFSLIKNKMWEKNFLINFGIYVGYKKKLNSIFYHIKFSRNRNFCSITRKIDFLNIF